MKAYLTFVDIERFVALIREHEEWFYKRNEKPDGKYSPSTRESWLRYIKLPTKELEVINDKLDERKKFKTINIAEFLVYINVAKDHNRGKRLVLDQPIFLSSDAKKVLQILLLGRLVENDYKKSKLTVNENGKIIEPLYKYLSHISDIESKSFYYLPGRTISLNQIKSLVEGQYSKCFTDSGIEKGIIGLLNAGLLTRTTCKELGIFEESNLYKLDFEGCYNFYQKIKSTCNNS